MPRIKIAPRKTGNTTDHDGKTTLVVAPRDALISKGEDTADLVLLRHPRSNKGLLYFFSADNKNIFEVLRLQEEKTSWFVNDTVIEEGSLTYFASYDPIFHILPYLMKCAKEGKTMPLEDALVDADFPQTRRILHCDGLKYLNAVAVMKGSPDLRAWAYNEEKTLKWLEKKFQKIVDGWKNLDVSNSRLCDVSENPDQVKHQAFDALAEYLPVELVTKLRQFLNLPDNPKNTDSPSMKRRVSGEVQVNSELRKALSSNSAPAKKRKTMPTAPSYLTSNKISNYFSKK